MITFAVTLKSGGDFVPYDAETLSRQVRHHMRVPHRFVVVTDFYEYVWSAQNIVAVPLEHGLPGWWSMVEMFRITGPVVASGLDMIVLDDIDRLAELALTCPPDVFYMARPQPRPMKNGERWCSGLQIWNGDWTWLYDEFMQKPEFYMEEFVKEQRFTYWHLERSDHVEIRAVQDYFNGYYSFKNQCRRGKPKDACVVLFHGHPRPNKCRERWVKDVYRNQYEFIHPWERLSHGKTIRHCR